MRREPIGVVGGDRAVELPADPGRVQVRARAGRRVHHRAEALTGNGARRVPARRGGRGRPDPAGRDQHRPGRPGDSAPTWSSTATWTSGLHRLDRGGRRIAETCGRLLRPVTLELGGKSAAIVLDDADLDLAKIGNDLFASTLLNNGQTCYLGTRVLAPRSRYDEVVDTLAAFASSLAVGDALDPATQIGPMASDRTATGSRLYRQGQPATAPGWSPAAGGPPTWTGAGSSSRPCSPTSTTPPRSRRRRSSAPSGRYPLRRRRRCSPDRQRLRLRPRRLGVDHRRRARQGRRPAGTDRHHRHQRYLPDPAAPFGGVKASGIGRELGPDASAPTSSTSRSTRSAQIRAMSMTAPTPGDPLEHDRGHRQGRQHGPDGHHDRLPTGVVGPFGPGRAQLGPDHALGPAALVPAPCVLVQLRQDAAVHLRRDPAVELGAAGNDRAVSTSRSAGWPSGRPGRQHPRPIDLPKGHYVADVAGNVTAVTP